MKNRIYKICCLLLAIILILCSCKGKEKDNQDSQSAPNADATNVPVVDISIPYSSSDSLNPFFASGYENQAIASLYCKPLFEVKYDFTAENVLADSCSVDGTSVTVTVKSDVFSDSSSLTASDVVYSFEKAKTSPAYSQKLTNVDSASLSGSNVIFTLITPDNLVKNILTFPIVKRNTAEDSQSTPIGSGTFYFEEKNILKLNRNSQTTSKINTVKLYDVKDYGNAPNELEIGNFNYLFEDFSNGEYKRIVARNKTVTLNNIVYIGLNMNDSLLSSAALRTAIYYAVDKQNVASAAYQGYCNPSASPFNPNFSALSGLDIPSVNGDREKSLSILKKLGFNYFATNELRTDGKNTLEFSLLVNNDNAFRLAAAQKIAENLNSQGFYITVDAVDFASYQQRIASGNFQMYLGEIKLSENCDLSVFKSGAASINMNTALSFFQNYEYYRQGALDTKTLLESFYNDMPFIPICYRSGMAAYSKNISPDFTYAPFNIYGNIENWETT